MRRWGFDPRAWVPDLLGNDDDKQLRELDHRLVTKWFANPPGTPRWWGTWPMLAREIEWSPHRTVGNSPLTYSERCFCLNEVAALISSRPLTSTIEPRVSALTPERPPSGSPTACLPTERSKNVLFATAITAKSCTTVAAREWFQPYRVILDNVERILLDHPFVTAEASYPLHLLQGWVEESRLAEHRHLPSQLARQEARAWMNYHQQ